MAKSRPTARLGSPYPDPPAATGVVPRWATRERLMWLWHGTAESRLRNIRGGIDLRLCQRKTDFGRGFYMTTYRQQAREWAMQTTLDLRHRQQDHSIRAAAIGFGVSLNELARLYSLPFIRPEPSNELFWSFVRHCRGLPVSDASDPSHYPDPTEYTHLCTHPAGGSCYDGVWAGGEAVGASAAGVSAIRPVQLSHPRGRGHAQRPASVRSN